MFDIIELLNVTDLGETIIINFKVKRDYVQAFINVLDGFYNATKNLSVKIRNAENLITERREEQQKKRHEELKQIKNQICATYKKNINSGLSIRLAFHETRKTHKTNNWLVTEVQKDLIHERELKILLLTNKGYTSKKISEELGIADSTVRKSLFLWRKANFSK